MRHQRQAQRPNMNELIAHRIATTVTPKKSRILWNKLLDSQISQYGFDFGIANVPKWAEGLAQFQAKNGTIPAAEFLGQKIAGLPQTTAMMETQLNNSTKTRDETLARRAGISPIGLQMAPPLPGQASARPMNGPGAALMPADAQGHGINDQGWAQTLSGMLGRGVLSQEQLQFASLNNVRSLIKGWVGGSEAERLKVTYILQRWIIEGFVNGLDTKRAIGNTRFNINLTNGGCGSGGCADGNGNLWFYNGLYSGSDSSAIAGFYHEIGHDRFKLDHLGGNVIMNPVMRSGSQLLADYNGMMGQYFNQARGSIGSTPVTKHPEIDVNAWMKANPQAFPSLSGTTVDPNAPPGPNGTGDNTTNNTTNNYSIPPAPTLAMSPLVQQDAGGGGPTSSPDEQANTPVAGVLPDMNQLHSFAAGLQDAASRGAPTIQGLAGALQQYKSG